MMIAVFEGDLRVALSIDTADSHLSALPDCFRPRIGNHRLLTLLLYFLPVPDPTDTI